MQREISFDIDPDWYATYGELYLTHGIGEGLNEYSIEYGKLLIGGKLRIGGISFNHVSVRRDGLSMRFGNIGSVGYELIKVDEK